MLHVELISEQLIDAECSTDFVKVCQQKHDSKQKQVALITDSVVET